MSYFISNQILDPEKLLKQVKVKSDTNGANLSQQATTKTSFSWTGQSVNSWNYIQPEHILTKKFLKVIIIDFGIKFSILRRLSAYGCHLIVLPASSSVKTVLSYKADGILLSNGPGDPSDAQEATSLISQLILTKTPIFGICMGHQILSQSLSFSTSKLKFGHRGINHPAGILQTVEITSQNHGFVVNADDNSCNTSHIQLTHYNLNDMTIAGIAHDNDPLFSVQYHPEASPGPHDSDYLFYYFISLIKQFNLQQIQVL